MREHASKVGGASRVHAEAAAMPAVGKQTLVEQANTGAEVADDAQDADLDEDGDRELASASSATAHAAGKHKKHKKGLGEVLAEAGEQILDGVKSVLESFGDELSKYSETGAEHAKHQLEHIRATCGPGSSHIERDVQVQADKLTNFYFARLMREAAVQARNMAKACHELHKGLHAHKHGALGSFIHEAVLAAHELVHEFGDFSKDVAEVDHIVHEISSRCGHKVQLEIPHALKPLVLPRPKYRFHINPKLVPLGPVITLPGLKITGGHIVLPRRIEIPKGPVLGDYVA